MHQIKLGGVGPSVSELALGCMRLCNLDTKAAESLLRTAMEQGINFLTTRIFMERAGRNRCSPPP